MSVPHGDVSGDEEGGLPPLPREIRLDRSRCIDLFGVDDRAAPSELSALSTPTPPYDPDLPRGFSLASRASADDIGRARRAFRLAASIGFLFMGILFGADLVFLYSGSDSHAWSMDVLSDARHGQARERTRAKANKAGKQSEEGERIISEDATEAHNTMPEEPQVQVATPTMISGRPSKEGKKTISVDAAPEKTIATMAHGMMPEEPQVATPHMISTIIYEWNSDAHPDVLIPEAHKRCLYVIGTFEEQNAAVTDTSKLRDKYRAQSADANVFYRATARLFWQDFGAGRWGREQDRSVNLGDLVLLRNAKYADGSPLSPMSTSTWITGDQHLSNFGAWLNRGGVLVFSVNDFDEGAIFDFQLDVLRAAVSICNHGFTNGLDRGQVEEALEEFAYTYAKTAIDYVGGDAELEYELTETTATGVLRDFLVRVNRIPKEKLVNKFTEVGDDGARRFVRNEKTRLEDAPPDTEEKIRAEMTSTRYGSTMMKMGWKVHGWDDDFFTVLDVARRLDSGVGSYGVDRFYVLLKGAGVPVILDVKCELESAVSSILEEIDPDEKAWYGALFRNEADRAAKAQRSLTSYTDPYVGYLIIDGNSYNVRERSPYKTSFDLESLTDPREFNEFVEQIAIATATAHVRGTVAKSPGQFKHVIRTLLAGGRSRSRWAGLVVKIALSYRSQVLLDFECFQQYIETMFPLDD